MQCITKKIKVRTTNSFVKIDGEEGYPGDVVINVTYTLTRENGLKIDIKGVTSKATPLNLANHVYFNLAGHETGAKGRNLFLPTFLHCAKVSTAINCPFIGEISQKLNTND